MNLSWKTPLCGLALVGALAVAGCGTEDERGRVAEPTGEKPSQETFKPAEASGEAKADVKVDIASFKFMPEAVKVTAGGKVTWLNKDKAPHTATADPGAADKFNTDTLQLGKSKTVTFDKPGEYKYLCLFHPFMVGSVTVE